MSETIETDVIIVGGGPVGLTLSYILGKSNINNIVLERSTTTSDWPKSNYIDPRSMELLSHIGLDKYICKVSLPENFMVASCASLKKGPPLGLARFTEEFVEKVHKKPDGSTIYVQQELAAQKPCRISQIQTEAALRQAAEELPSSEIHYGWEVTNVSQDEDGVTAEVSIGGSAETKTIEGRFLVGCDGANSFVRKSLGISYAGKFNVGKFRSIFFESSELQKRLHNSELMAYLVIRHDFRAIIFPVDTEKLFVIRILLTEDEEGASKKSAEYYIKSILDNADDVPFEILQDHLWKTDIVHAESFQFGKVILAGDSAHLMAPLDGIGMFCGMTDVFNLGWKLIATIHGWGGEWLLDSYASESLRFYKKVIKINENGLRVLKSSDKTSIFLMNAIPFKYLFSICGKFHYKTVGNEGLIFGMMLHHSPICVPSGLESPIEDREYYISEPYSACRVPHFRFEDGSTLLSKLGDMFTLICFSPCPETCKYLVKYAKEASLPLKVLTYENDDLRKLFKTKMVLIRPDLYIAWCGDEIPQLSENESLRTQARVLINVVSGATPLPPEWSWSRVKKVAPVIVKPRRHYWILPLFSVFICLAGIAVYNIIQ